MFCMRSCSCSFLRRPKRKPGASLAKRAHHHHYHVGIQMVAQNATYGIYHKSPKLTDTMSENAFKRTVNLNWSWYQHHYYSRLRCALVQYDIIAIFFRIKYSPCSRLWHNGCIISSNYEESSRGISFQNEGAQTDYDRLFTANMFLNYAFGC